jgi:nitrite reductase/ring-hydroxylating ferredoxin subunit
MAFLRAAAKDEVSPGTIRELEVGDKVIALANVEGKFFAVNNVCLHRGGPLGEGELDRQVVTCPWHGWQFDVTNGLSGGGPRGRLLRRYWLMKDLAGSMRATFNSGTACKKSPHKVRHFFPLQCIVRAADLPTNDATTY